MAIAGRDDGKRWEKNAIKICEIGNHSLDTAFSIPTVLQ
jgi:hypothetical protein